MDPSSPVADVTSFYIQEIGAILFGTVFLFLYRQSKVVYFGLWAVAWGMRVLATLFGYELLRTQHSGKVLSLRASNACGGFVPAFCDPAAAGHALPSFDVGLWIIMRKNT